LEDSEKKKALRDLLLERRDNTSHDLLKIASKKIQKKLDKIFAFKNAKKIGVYYPIGIAMLLKNTITAASLSSQIGR